MLNLRFRIVLIAGIFSIIHPFNRIFPQSVRINEIMAVNQATLTDEDGDYSDWIEIYNPGPVDVDLTNWALTDDEGFVRKWIFPGVTVKKGTYLIIFASGKNRRKPGEELHTNFSLDGNGEFLGLFNSSGNPVSVFSPGFPYLPADISYGYLNGGYVSFTLPTPGSENDPSSGTIPSGPDFSRKHGFYDSPFSLEISSADPAFKIYYTTNGNSPDATRGTLYTGPINISSTAIIRAVLVKDNQPAGRIITQTYLFPDDIIHQPNNPAGYPATWGPFLSISGIAPADYEMDPEMISDPQFANSLKEALHDLPVISLVTDRNYLFSKTVSADSGGIYIYTGTAEGLGYGWERPVSFEYFDDSDSISYQANCGLQIQGGEGRRPEKSPKHSFRLLFKGMYGPTKFNFPMFGDDAVSEFDNIILRAGFNNTWIHWSNADRTRAQYIRDRWTKDTQLAMGHPASHGIYVHLFINGMYWGLYNPSERMDGDFAASYLGGNPADYDVIKDYAEAVDGYITTWDALINMANAGLSGNQAYQRIQGNNPDGTRNPAFEPLVDVVSLADYMIINFYGANTDWDHHNWVAIRNRVNPGSGFKFFCWDAEHNVEGINANILTENNDKCPSRIFQQLRQNPDFRRLFADRVQKLCFNNGLLTPSRAAGTWLKIADQIDRAVIAESARWGDYRRDVHQYQKVGPFDLYTRENYWIPQKEYLLNSYFPVRTNNFINHLRSAGLFPSVDGPVFLIDNNPVLPLHISSGAQLTMSASKGIIYYTTDGSDPVTWGTQPSISPAAIQYTGPMVLNLSSHIKARVIYNNEWSATTDQFFSIKDDFNDLKITEINYHPLDDEIYDNSELEFIEIKNTGESTLDLGGIKFTEGINYEFPVETYLGAKEFIVLASNNKAFFERYGFIAYDEYDGQLNNSGEMLIMLGPDRDTLCNIVYESSNGWPEAPDGEGKSLVPINPNPSGSQDMPELWRESFAIGGSPGEDDNLEFTNEKTMDLVTVYPNYPNPFIETTKFRYTLLKDAHVRITILDFYGNVVDVPEDILKPAGYYECEWRGTRNDRGLYFYNIEVWKGQARNKFTGKLIRAR